MVYWLLLWKKAVTDHVKVIDLPSVLRQGVEVREGLLWHVHTDVRSVT